MADTKFSSSEFAVQSSVTESDSVVGYGGAANKKWTFTTIWNWITSKANSLYARLASANTFTAANTFNAAATFANDVIINSRIKGASLYTGYEKQTYWLPANTAKWVRLLVSNNNTPGVLTNYGRLVISMVSSGSDTFDLDVYNNYNTLVACNIKAFVGSTIRIKQFRHVFKENTYTNEYGYFEVYLENLDTWTASFNIFLFNSNGWAFAVGDGSVPSGYTTKTFSAVSNGNSSMEQIRKLVTFANPLTIDARAYGNNYYTYATGLNGTLTVNVNYLQEGREVTLLVLGYTSITGVTVAVRNEENELIEQFTKTDAYPFAAGSRAYITVKNVGREVSIVKIEKYG